MRLGDLSPRVALELPHVPRPVDDPSAGIAQVSRQPAGAQQRLQVSHPLVLAGLIAFLL